MKTLNQKLQIAPTMRGKILNKPENIEMLSLPESRRDREPTDFLLIFAQEVDELDAAVKDGMDQLKIDPLIWVCFPKKTDGFASDISRDYGWECLDELGYQPIRQIALDDFWAALLFRDTRFIEDK